MLGGGVWTPQELAPTAEGGGAGVFKSAPPPTKRSAPAPECRAREIHYTAVAALEHLEVGSLPPSACATLANVSTTCRACRDKNNPTGFTRLRYTRYATRTRITRGITDFIVSRDHTKSFRRHIGSAVALRKVSIIPAIIPAFSGSEDRRSAFAGSAYS